LDDKQFQAAVDLFKQRRPMVSEYWSDYLEESQALKSGDAVVGLAGHGEPHQDEWRGR
jgi:putative spermidine/putrescine transport system substrate-binding protein